MKSKIVFGKWESITLLINTLCTQIFLNFPRMVVEKAGPGGWILTLYISALAFLSFFIIYKLYRGFEGMDLIDISEYLGGKTLGIIVGLIVISLLTFVTALILREFSEDMKVISLVASPISFVGAFFLLGMIIAAYVGMETIVRFHAIAVPIISTGYLIIIFGVAPYYNIVNLTPILGTGAFKIFAEGSLQLSVFTMLILILFITPFIGSRKNFKSIGFIALGFCSFFLFAASFTYIMVAPYPANTEFFLPIYHMARMINYGRFFQRVEPIFVFVWAAAAFLLLSTMFFFIVYVFKRTFRLEFYRPLIFPFAILIFNLSFLPESLMNSVSIETKFYSNYGWIFSILLAIVVLLFAGIKRRIKGRIQNKEA